MDSQVKRKRGVKMTKSCTADSDWVTLKHTHTHTAGAGRSSARFRKLAHTFSNPLPLPHSPCCPVSLHLCPCTEIAKNITLRLGKSHVSILDTHAQLSAPSQHTPFSRVYTFLSFLRDNEAMLLHESCVPSYQQMEVGYWIISILDANTDNSGRAN